MHAAIGVIPDDHAGIVVLTNLGGASLQPGHVHRVAPDLDAFLGESGFATFAFGGDGKVASGALSQFADVVGGRFSVKPAS
jgi:hypothetical protein